MKPKMLLHACCAPCSSSVIEKLKNDFDLTIFFYNPNIYPQEEFTKRAEELNKYLTKQNINYVICEYNHDEYISQISGLEKEQEGGKRCFNCYQLRLKKTLEYAIKNNFEYFCTTLSVSPHKNAEWLNQIGKSFETEKCKYFESNFKKQDGYLRSLQISKQENFYRQNYCGCEYSK